MRECQVVVVELGILIPTAVGIAVAAEEVFQNCLMQSAI